MNTNTSLRMAVALLVGTAMHGAMAASPTDPIKIASETGSATLAGSTEVLKGGAFPNFDIPVINNKMITSTARYYVVINLTGGAQFGKTANLGLECGYSALAVGVAGTTALADSPAATTGGSVAAFQLNSANGQGIMTGSCRLVFDTTALVLTSGMKDYGITITARHLDPSESVSSSVSGTLVTFTQGLQVSVSAGTVTVDVTSPSLSKKFLVTGSVEVTAASTAIANLGVIRYAQIPGVVSISGANAAAGTYVNTLSLVVSGLPIAAVQSTAAATVSGGIFLNRGAACSGATGALTSTLGMKYASGNQVAFDAVTPANLLEATTGSVSICMVANEAVTIDRGVVSFTLTAAALGTSTPNTTSVDTVLTKVDKNGTSLKALNVPSPDNAVDQAFIRFYNMGSTTGKIFGTLYSQDNGTVLGTSSASLIDSLAPNTVAVLSSSQLATKFGITTWPGKAWLQIESEIKGLRVQALIRSNGAAGTLMNMSDRVMYDGEIMERTE